MFEDKAFMQSVESNWQVKEAGYKSVHPKETEALVTAIRLNLMKMGSEKHTEEFVLREIFR